MATADISDGADAWSRRVLGNQLRRRGVPESAIAARIARPGRLVSYVASLGLSPARAVRVSVPQAVRGARKAAARSRREAARNRLHEILVECGKPENARWSWTSSCLDTYWLARIVLGGRFHFEVRFGGCDGRFQQGWSQAHGTHLLLSLVRELRLGGTGRTGLFPSIDRCLREATADFLGKVRPDSLEIVGADAVRNAHNVVAYASLGVPGYECVERLDPGSPRASALGVVAVELVRVDEGRASPGSKRRHGTEADVAKRVA